MVDGRTELSPKEGMDMPVRSLPIWLVWAVAVPLIIIAFGVLNYFGAQREIHESIVRTRHIVIRCDHQDAAASSAALERIREIKAQLDAGADFAELARKYSEDQSAEKGGDVGYEPLSKFAGECAWAMFSLKKGEISDIVKTEYGYHIIQMVDRVDPPEAAD